VSKDEGHLYLVNIVDKFQADEFLGMYQEYRQLGWSNLIGNFAGPRKALFTEDRL
jgi:hypothetical protein